MTVALGLDLSMTSSGLAFVHTRGKGTTIVTTRAIKSAPAKPEMRTANVKARRLGGIVREIETAVMLHRPDVAVVESPVPGGRMKSALLLERGAVYWMTLDMLDRYGVEIVECSPRERALYATGDGGADKMSVARSMLAEHDREFATDDECDAFVLATIGLRLHDLPVDADLPHRLTVTANLAAKRGKTP